MLGLGFRVEGLGFRIWGVSTYSSPNTPYSFILRGSPGQNPKPCSGFHGIFLDFIPDSPRRGTSSCNQSCSEDWAQVPNPNAQI